MRALIGKAIRWLIRVEEPLPLTLAEYQQCRDRVGSPSPATGLSEAAALAPGNRHHRSLISGRGDPDGPIAVVRLQASDAAAGRAVPAVQRGDYSSSGRNSLGSKTSAVT
jgi:hypothetical protein